MQRRGTQRLEKVSSDVSCCLSEMALEKNLISTFESTSKKELTNTDVLLCATFNGGREHDRKKLFNM